MTILDMRTVIISYGISNLICMIVMAIIWRQYRRKFAGIGFWLATAFLQFVGLILIALRGIIPDIFSIAAANVILVGGTMLLLLGLERFTGERSSQLQNTLLLVIFVLVQSYFVFVLPNLTVRRILFSLALLAICAQSAWLMLYRVGPKKRTITRGVGHVMIMYCLVSIARIGVDLVVPSGNDFFHPNAYDALVIITYQMLLILLAFALSMMVNRRLSFDLEGDIEARKQVEEALRKSEEKFFKSFHFSPDAILITRLRDGKLIDVNEGFCRMTGYTVDEALSSSTVDLQLWLNPMDRKKMVDELRRTQRIHNRELDFRTKPGGVINGIYSAEIIQLGDESYILSVVRDISERKQMELALRAEKAFTDRALDAQQDTLFVFNPSTGKAVRWNKAFREISGHTDEEISRLKAPDAYYAREDLEKAAQMMKEIFEKGFGVVELEFICKDGRKIPFEYVASIMYNDSGEPENFISVGRDITERKRAEATLEYQNTILSALQQTTLELLSELDLDTLLENIVKRAGVLVGTTAGYLDLVEPATGELKPRVGVGALAESLDHVAQPGEGVAGTVWQTGKPLIIDDYDLWSGRVGTFSRNIIRSICGVPLISGNQVIGVLGLAHETSSERLFTPEDVELLTQFARLVTIAIENAHLYQAAQQELTERKRMEAIFRLRLQLWEYAIDHQVEELMQKSLDEIGELTLSPIGFYHFVEKDQNTLSLQAWSSQTMVEFCQMDRKGLHYPIAEAGVWVDAIHQRKPVIHNDYGSLPHRKGMPDGHAPVIRELVVPVMRDDKIVAILGVGNKPADYDQKDAELVSYIGDLVWTIVEQQRANEKIVQLNEKLEILAMTDELTGLFNRRLFFQRGAEEIRRSQRYHTPLSILMMDIDLFKQINDTYGHDVGDHILRYVSNVLQHHIRDIDMLARLGGEEFGILLPNTEYSNAIITAERIRLEIERSTCSFQNHTIEVTMSIGVAAYEQDVPDIDHLLKNADTAMYQAKNQGRNRVVLFA